jgi:hypothetical protein
MMMSIILPVIIKGPMILLLEEFAVVQSSLYIVCKTQKSYQNPFLLSPSTQQNKIQSCSSAKNSKVRSNCSCRAEGEEEIFIKSLESLCVYKSRQTDEKWKIGKMCLKIRIFLCVFNIIFATWPGEFNGNPNLTPPSSSFANTQISLSLSHIFVVSTQF